MTRKNHQDIYDQLTAKWQEDKFRRQQEILNIGKPRLADLVLGWIFTIIAVTGIVLILMYINKK
jgi:hypothetical protein